MRRGRTFAVLCMLALGCGDDDGTDVTEDMGALDVDAGPVDMGPPPPFEPDSYCPGGDGCPSGNDGTLMVGSAMRDITPIIDENTDTLSVDVNGNAIWDPGDGDEYIDANDNGVFDPVFIAGFGSPRPASGVHDPQWARAVVMRTAVGRLSGSVASPCVPGSRQRGTPVHDSQYCTVPDGCIILPRRNSAFLCHRRHSLVGKARRLLLQLI